MAKTSVRLSSGNQFLVSVVSVGQPELVVGLAIWLVMLIASIRS